MKIVLFENDFADFAAAFMESLKPKTLKNLIVMSRNSQNIKKLDSKVNFTDYSEFASGTERGFSDSSKVQSVEPGYITRLKSQFAVALEKAGDVLFILSCEQAQMAIFPVIQQVCRENHLRSHFLFIAPFLFQGKKQAENMRNMLKMVDDDYNSVSLYYADELLDLSNHQTDEENENNEQQNEAYNMQRAYDALEHAVVEVVNAMYLQIPNLIKGMQYTYNFTDKQFLLAVDPLQLILSMWRSVIDEEFKEEEQEDKAEGVKAKETGKHSAAEIRELARLINRGVVKNTASQSTGKNAGILDPERKKRKKSVYESIARNSIPLNAYRKQVNENALTSITDRIKEIIYGDGGEVDPEVRKKTQERLMREIRKFQVRQAEAKVKFEGDQPTVVLGMAEALAEVYLHDSEEDLSKPEQSDKVMRQYGSTPYQRAAWAADQRNRLNEIADASAGEASHKQKHEENAAMMFVSGEYANDMEEYFNDLPTDLDEIAASSEQLMRLRNSKENKYDNVHAQATEDDISEDFSDKGKGLGLNESIREYQSVNDMDSADKHNIEESDNIKNEVKLNDNSETNENDNHSDYVYDKMSERSRKKAERQVAKMSKKLAKAEEKAAIANAKAKMAAKQIEIITREKEK